MNNIIKILSCIKLSDFVFNTNISVDNGTLIYSNNIENIAKTIDDIFSDTSHENIVVLVNDYDDYEKRRKLFTMINNKITRIEFYYNPDCKCEPSLLEGLDYIKQIKPIE